MGEIADALKRSDVGVDKATGRQRIEKPETEPDNTYSRAIDVTNTTSSLPSSPGLPADGRIAEEAAYSIREDHDDEPRLEIPTDRGPNWISRVVIVAPNGAPAECYRHLAIRVSRELEQRKVGTLLVASGLRMEGKTTTACNLALALAQMGGRRRVALVDFDLRKPSLTRVFSMTPEIGLEEVLSGHAAASDVRVRTSVEGLDLFPVSRAVAQPHELLAGEPMAQLMRELERAYDTVIVDSAPLLLVPDTELIYPHVGAVTAVMRAGRTKRKDFERLVESIPPAKLIGTFMNDVRTQRHIKRYGYYGHEG